MQPKRNLAPLTGALFVVLTLVAFFAIGGSTPEGDDSAQKVVSFYSDNESKEIIAAVALALAAVALIFFSATLRQRLEAASPGRGTLPTAALGAGIIADKIEAHPLRVGTDYCAVLGVHGWREDNLATLAAILREGHVDCLRGGRGAVVVGGIRNLHAREGCHQGLVLEYAL